MSITCEFEDCKHIAVDGECGINPTLRLFSDGYNMIFSCEQMDLQDKVEDESERWAEWRKTSLGRAVLGN